MTRSRSLGASVMLASVSVAAAWWPAWRAVRHDPFAVPRENWDLFAGLRTVGKGPGVPIAVIQRTPTIARVPATLTAASTWRAGTGRASNRQATSIAGVAPLMSHRSTCGAPTSMMARVITGAVTATTARRNCSRTAAISDGATPGRRRAAGRDHRHGRKDGARTEDNETYHQPVRHGVASSGGSSGPSNHR
jgi:hypothetical protein